MKKLLTLILIITSLNSFAQNAFKGANTHAVKVDYETNLGSTFTSRSLVDKGYVDSLIAVLNTALGDYLLPEDTTGTTKDYGAITGKPSYLNTRWPGTYIESPTASDFVGLFYTPVAITITSVHSVLVGSSSPSVTFNLAFGSDLSSMTNVFTSGQTVTSTTTGLTSNSGFNDATIPPGWVKFTTSAMSGTVTAIWITPIYTID